MNITNLIFSLKKYNKIIQFVFILFLFGVLTFSRNFSSLYVKTSFVPFFITEIILFLSLPLIITYYKHILKLQKKFLTILCIYFLLGCFYLFFGLLNKNIFALRDIVLCGYILFFPLTLITFSEKHKLKIFLFILVLSNIIMLIVGRFYLLDFSFMPAKLASLFNKIKNFNFGLNYGIAVSFLIPFFIEIKKTGNRILNIFIVILLSLNLYMLIFLGIRTLWISFTSLLIFFLLIFKAKFIKTFIFSYVLLIISIFSMFYYSDSRFINSVYYQTVISKAANMEETVKNIFKGHQEPTPPEKAPIQEPTPPEKAPIEVSKELPKKPSVTSDTPIFAPPSAYSILPSWKYNRCDNITFRLDIWWQAIHFGLKSPIFGRGFGVYPRYIVWERFMVLPKHIGVESGIIPTHNHLISIFYKMGFLGLFLFLFINFYVLAYGLKYINKCNDTFNKCFLIGSLGAFVFWHTMALFFDIIDSPPTSIFLWIIIGFIFSVIEIDKDAMKKLTSPYLNYPRL